MALVDGEGRRNEADPDKFGYIPDGRNIFLENVNPGVTDQGQAIFTVAPGSTGFELELGDADLLSDVHGTVPLGICRHDEASPSSVTVVVTVVYRRSHV